MTSGAMRTFLCVFCAILHTANAAGVWSQWYNSDSPTVHRGVDDETIARIVVAYELPCHVDDITAVQCRMVGSNATFSNQRLHGYNVLHVPCNTSGLLCRDEDQTVPGVFVCVDYEIRVLCGKERADDGPLNYEDLASNGGFIAMAAGASIVFPLVCVLVIQLQKSKREERRRLERLQRAAEESASEADLNSRLDAPPAYEELFGDPAEREGLSIISDGSQGLDLRVHSGGGGVGDGEFRRGSTDRLLVTRRPEGPGASHFTAGLGQQQGGSPDGRILMVSSLLPTTSLGSTVSTPSSSSSSSSSSSLTSASMMSSSSSSSLPLSQLSDGFNNPIQHNQPYSSNIAALPPTTTLISLTSSGVAVADVDPRRSSSSSSSADSETLSNTSTDALLPPSPATASTTGGGGITHHDPPPAYHHHHHHHHHHNHNNNNNNESRAAGSAAHVTVTISPESSEGAPTSSSSSCSAVPIGSRPPPRPQRRFLGMHLSIFDLMSAIYPDPAPTPPPSYDDALKILGSSVPIPVKQTDVQVT